MLTACTWWVVECRAGGAKIERGPEPAVTPSGSRTAGPRMRGCSSGVKWDESGVSTTG